MSSAVHKKSKLFQSCKYKKKFSSYYVNPQPVKPQVNASSTEHSQMLKTNGRMNDPKQIQQSQIEDCPIDVTISKDDVGVNDPEELKGCLQNTIQVSCSIINI